MGDKLIGMILVAGATAMVLLTLLVLYINWARTP
jgi:hypothetical protein